MAEKIVTVATDSSQLDPSQIAQLKQLLATIEGSSKPQKRKPRKKDAVKYLSEEQLEQFFRVIKSPRDTAIFRLIYHRGLRASEVGKLQLSDWNRDRDRIRFARLKGSHGGEYRLTVREVKVLRTWLRVRGVEPGPLFPSRRRKGISQQM